MLPWFKLASARAPDGTELSLWQRGDELVVRAGGVDLMSTRSHGSEDFLATIGCERIASNPGRATVLIGGLGLGSTLRASLAALPSRARVIVAELVPEVVGWVRGPARGAAILDDPRVTVEPRDCAAILRESVARFDAIMLDVDNGPSALTQAANRSLYSHGGLVAAARALRPGGRFAVWSAGEDRAFLARMGRAGFAARVVRARAHEKSGARHVIFVGEVR
jgi:spermidine synthase